MIAWLCILASLGFLLTPEPLWAWGPGTHVGIGKTVLGALYLLPPAIRAILREHPIPFLYGSVAADISFGKKYAPEGRHCHHWHVGEEILASATTDPLKAVGYGYLAHLAADTVAHNFFVPRCLLFTSGSQGLGHTYWEHRMDVAVGKSFLGEARSLVVDFDHDAADALFDEVLSRTIFSFKMNRRIFRGVIRIQGTDRWKNAMDQLHRNARLQIREPLANQYLGLSADFVIDYLLRGHDSSAAALDPIGDLNLRLAKKIRRRALGEGLWTDPELMNEMANDFFPLPENPPTYLPEPPLQTIRSMD